MVTSSGAQAKIERLMTLISRTVDGALPEVAVALALNAQTRAPSVDSEYNELMAGSGEQAMVPRSGDRSADTDGRIRLEKPESTYIWNTIVSPVNFQINGHMLRFGNLMWLNENAYFSYTNLRAVGGHGKNHVTEYETETYRKSGYFEAFEYGSVGSSAMVYPSHQLQNGHAYPLRPGEGPDGAKTSMYKPISAHFMFMPFLLKEVADLTLTTALRKIESK